MIHKMLALYDFIPQEYIDKHNDEYGLVVESKPDWKVISMNFIRDGGAFILNDSTLSDYDSARNLSDYFYRNAPGNSVSPFPSIFITEVGFRSDREYSKDSKDYKNFLKTLKNSMSINDELKGLYYFFENSSEEVFSEIDKYLGVGTKGSYVFTLSIDGLHIGRSPLFEKIRAQAAEEFYSDFYTLNNKKITGRNMTCSMCNTLRDELWGFVSIYNFYTSKTELAPIAGGLKKELAHNNYPVCPQCAAKLRKLRPIVDKYFGFRFCGFNYLLLPEVIFDKVNNNPMKQIVDIMVAQYGAEAGSILNLESRLGEFSIGQRRNLVDNYNKEVFDYLAEMNNYASFTMLFFAKSNQEFKILLTIEDVFPSQFKAIFKAIDEAEAHDIFQKLPGKDPGEHYDLKFRFNLVKEFFPIDDKIEGNFSKTFLELTRSIFTQKPVSYSFILHRVANIISRRFANGSNFELATRKAFLMLKFFSSLGIINQNNEYTNKEVNVTDKYAVFFEEHRDFFGSSAKQYVFLTGVLAQYLINIQMHDKGAAPFRKRLNSMKLDSNLVHRIFTEAREKLIQYDKNYYQELEQEIADLMVKGGIEKLSNDEISFLFTLGMTLNKKFKETKTQEPDLNE